MMEIDSDVDVVLNERAICDIIRLHYKNQGLEYENVTLRFRNPCEVQAELSDLKKDEQ